MSIASPRLPMNKDKREKQKNSEKELVKNARKRIIISDLFISPFLLICLGFGETVVFYKFAVYTLK